MDKQNTGVVSLLELHTKTAMELARFKLLIRSERFKRLANRAQAIIRQSWYRDV